MNELAANQQREADLEWVRGFVSAKRWQTGKADPTHQYTVREWSPDEIAFKRMITLILKYGESRCFWNKTYTYLVVDGMRYWQMDLPEEENDVINRAKEE